MPQPRPEPAPDSGPAPGGSAEPSDGQLFREITAHRSEPALEILFRRYFERLCEFAFRLSGSHAAAEEVVVALFHRLHADGAALGVPENVVAYLFAATRRRLLNQQRGEARRRHAETLAADPAEAPPDDGRRLILFREMESEIERLLQQLPPRRQMVFRLHRIEGLSYREIADVLEISPNTVKAQMTEALRDLDRLREM